MLCYRCGSYNADGLRKCSICGQVFAGGRRPSRSFGARPSSGSLIAPYGAGTRVADRYRITGPGGVGAAGWVMRARDEEVDVDVAVKLMAGHLLQSPQDRARLLAVLRRARKLHHANVVRIYDVGEWNDTIYYTMPFLEGLSLRKIIDLRLERSQTFDAQEILPILGQLAVGLESLGKLQCHGALRPHNAVVLPDILKITGVAHLHGLPRRPFVAQQAQMSKTTYLAPEVCNGEDPPTVASDVYALGALAGEMLTGVTYGSEEGEWERATEKLPPGVTAVLERALVAAPQDRYAKPTGFFDALADAVGGLPRTPVPTPIEDEITIAEANERRSESSRSVEMLTPIESTDVPFPEPLPQEDTGASGVHLAAVELAKAQQRSSQHHGAGKSTGFAWSVLVAALLVAGLAGGGWWWLRHRPSLASSPVPTAEPSPVAVEVPPPVPRVLESVTLPPASKERPRRRARGADRERVAVMPEAAPKGRAEPMEQAQAKVEAPATEPESVSESEAVVVPAAAPKAPGGACPEGMVAVPGGSALIGSQPADPMRGFGDKLAHKERVDPFCVDVREYPNQPGTSPVTQVSWGRARDLCARAGKRLCTESEWEYACAGPNALRFPFGNDYREGACNLGDGRALTQSGASPACRSAFGVLDLAGNAAEWTASRWSNDIPDRVVKGGAAGQAAYSGRCAARVNEAGSARHRHLGFRCCADPRR